MEKQEIKRADIIKLADNIIDNIGETINIEICDKFGNSLDWEITEEISNLIYSQIKIRM